MEPAIIVHGGVGQPSSHSDGTNEAARAGMDILNGGGDAFEAVVKAVMMLEDDERFNAGTGSRLNLKGNVEMDAVVMDSRGRLGAVAAIKDVKNPVLVAQKVAQSPHRVMAGEGATEFARRYGFKKYDPVTDKNIERLERYKGRILKNDLPEFLGDWRPYTDLAHDTVGAIAIDRRNVFAAASSTGGTSIQLQGRVSDVPVIGAGIWVGKDGAVVSTGMGEYIIEKVLSFQVYNKIPVMGAKEAADWGVAQYQKEIPIGVLDISKDGWGVSANLFMACTIMTWDTTLNGSEIWPSGEVEQDETTPVLVPQEASQEHHERIKRPDGGTQRALEEVVAPSQPSIPQTVQPPPIQAPTQNQPAPSKVEVESVPAKEPVPQQPPPRPAPTPTHPMLAPGPERFKCPYCQKIFAVAVTFRPVSVHCPHCAQAVSIQ